MSDIDSIVEILKENTPNIHDALHGYANMNDTYKAVSEQILAAMGDGWISVDIENNKPEEFKEVMFYTPWMNFFDYSIGYWLNTESGGRRWMIANTSKAEQFWTKLPKFYKPLPEPPSNQFCNA